MLILKLKVVVCLLRISFNHTKIFLNGLFTEKETKGLSKNSSGPSFNVSMGDAVLYTGKTVSFGSTPFLTYFPFASLGFSRIFFQSSSETNDIY